MTSRSLNCNTKSRETTEKEWRTLLHFRLTSDLFLYWFGKLSLCFVNMFEVFLLWKFFSSSYYCVRKVAVARPAPAAGESWPGKSCSQVANGQFFDSSTHFNIEHKYIWVKKGVLMFYPGHINLQIEFMSMQTFTPNWRVFSKQSNCY